MKKNIKKVTVVGLLTAMLFTRNVFAAAGINIKVDGLLQPISTETMNKDGYTLVGMRDMFNMLGASVDWNNVKRCITAKKDGKTVVLYVDDNTAEIDGKKTDIEPVGVEIVDGTTMVPLRFVSEVFGADVNWDMDTQTIEIKNDTGKYLLLNDKQNVPEETTVLAFEDALAMAKKNNSQLKNLDDAAYYLDDLRSDLGNNLHAIDEYGVFLNSYEIGAGPTGSISDSDALQLSLYENVVSSIQVIRNIKSVDVSLSETSVNEEMINDSIQLGLISAINDIKTYEMNIQVLEQKIALDEQNLENIKLKFELGMESEYNYKTEQTNLKTSKSNLESLKLGLESQKQNLKTLLGAKASEEIFVDDNVEFNTLDDFDLEVFITKKTQADPSIVLLKDAVDIAKYNLKTNASYTDENTTKVQNDLKSAQRTLEDTQDQMEKNIRNTYNSLKQLEENNKTLLLAVEQAKSDYNAIVSSYQAGRATQYQVDQAKLGILNAEKAVEDNAITYENLSFCLMRPYLLAGASN